LEKSCSVVFSVYRGKLLLVRKMKINNRLLSILNFLEKKPETTIKEISEYLEISDRSVRYEIENLNFLLDINGLPLVKKGTKGSLSFGNNPEKSNLAVLLNSINTCSKEERIRYIKLIFLAEGTVNISSLSRTLDVSRTTIRADIKEIIAEFSAENITVKENCLYMSEKNIRNYILKYFHKDLIQFYYYNMETMDKNMIQEYFYLYISDLNIVFLKDFIENTLKKLESNANNFHEYIFNYLVLLYIRLKNNRHIQKVENESFLRNTAEFRIITQQLKELAGHIKIVFSEEEKLLICDYILGFLSYSYNTSIFEYWIKTEVIIKNLINKVNIHTQINISNDEELLRSLLGHIKPTIYRLKNNLAVEHEIYIEAVEAYPELFNIIKNALFELEELIGKEIPDSEIALFTLHFLASLERNKENERKKVILICGGGYGTSMLVAGQIKQNYNLEIIDTISYMQFLDYDISNIDLVITTLNLKEYSHKHRDIPVIKISPFFTYNDQKKLSRFLTKKKSYDDDKLKTILKIIERNSIIQNMDTLVSELSEVITEKEYNKEITETKNLLYFISKEKAVITKNSVSWEEALKICGNILVKTGDISEKYIDEILNLTENFGAHFVLENGIAIPHGEVDKNVFKSSISILLSKKPVIFPEQKKVSLIFFISAKTTKDHLKSVEEIMKISQNKDFLAEISLIKESHLIIQTIEKYLK
jgi:mannitol operon transcriptional antiterminator